MRRYLYILMIFAIFAVGCSSSSNPINSDSTTRNYSDTSILSPGVIGLSGSDGFTSAIGLIGAYELTVNSDDLSANLVPRRSSAIGESYIVSGIAFFTISPCQDCLKIKGLSLDPDYHAIVTFDIRHPFKKGDTMKPPSAMNRLDLDVFDVALVVQPVDIDPVNYPLTGDSIYTGICTGADGYTSELVNLLDDDSAMPYFLVVDDKAEGTNTWNKFEMGAFKSFDTGFCLSDSTLTFNLYLTMGYGASAKKPTRLNPVYFNPEFNRKSAWKVDVIPPGPPESGFTWQQDDNTTTFDVEIHVYDWQQDATVYSNPDDFANAPADNIYAASNVSMVSVEIPGMTNDLKSSTTADSGTGKPDDPLVYKIPIANENLLGVGEYMGLVKVSDERNPSLNWMSDLRDYMIDTDDGIILENYLIPEYSTYQVFIATVVEEPFIPPGDLMWAKNAVGPDDDQGFAIAGLSDNSMVVSGYFRSSITFAQGETNQTTLNSAGQNDIFIARYDPNGALVWVKRVGAAGWETTFGITAFPDDSVVITGIFGWTVVFGQGEANQTTLVNYPNDGVFVARYNPDGTLRWAKAISGTGRAYGMGVASCSDGSTYATGWFAGTYTFGSGEPNQTALTNTAGYNEFTYRDIYIAKYNPNGTLAWAKRAGGSAGRNDGIAVTALSDNTAVVTGYFTNTGIFGQGEVNQTSLVSSGVEDTFVAAFNSTNGQLLWAKKAGGASTESGQSITTLSDNTIVATGFFSASSTFGPGETNETLLTSAGNLDIFIARYNSNGTLVWAKNPGGINNDIGYAVTKLPGDTIVFGGYFTTSAVFGSGEPVEITLTTSSTSADSYIAWYNPDGTVLWAEHAAEGTTDSNTIRSISVLTDNSLAVTGPYRSPLTVGPGDPNETLLNWVATYDVWIARFGP
jgi:hypothetical protein